MDTDLIFAEIVNASTICLGLILLGYVVQAWVWIRVLRLTHKAEALRKRIDDIQAERRRR